MVDTGFFYRIVETGHFDRILYTGHFYRIVDAKEFTVTSSALIEVRIE
jgi:hypothetical protein